MTGATILLSMTDKFNKAKLAPCIANPDVPSGCSYYNLLPRKMCQYIKGDLPEDSDPDHLYPVYFYDAVTLVNWLDLNRACLEDLALHHSVLLVSLEQNYVYMLRGEHSDPILNQYGTQYKTNDFHMYRMDAKERFMIKKYIKYIDHCFLLLHCAQRYSLIGMLHSSGTTTPNYMRVNVFMIDFLPIRFPQSSRRFSLSSGNFAQSMSRIRMFVHRKQRKLCEMYQNCLYGAQIRSRLTL
ncbi:unnamed protein product [Albugo candida]|uniref:Uncharacterized protein n=1 Tax=Albugo candida TaxID=65357 RepID=A0A024GLL0_9STRA|nr:unnamed protein product [Albugo candida]|eukprot:CCI47615.1 unnamed protein product [Albugo candida]